MLTVDLLGTVEVRRDGVLLPVPAGKTTELLVRLALEPGQQVRTDTLIEELWGRPDASRNMLQSKVSQLRRALGDRDAVRGMGEGYALAIGAGQVDAHRALTLAAEAAAAAERDDPATVLEKSNEALELFRGELLVDQGEWAAVHRARLEEVRLTLLERSLEARTHLGAGDELVAELEVLVARHPLRERLWASLITALFRAGRQADALAAYGRVRTLLIGELGVEPGPALRQLEADVLQHSARLSPATGHAALSTPGNLPTLETDLVGRADDQGAVSSMLTEHRLVCIAGTAGVGKTALATSVAQQLCPPGGVWIIRLEVLDSSADLQRVIAETLHVPGGARGLLERLTGAETILVLDNCEHLVQPVAEFVESLLRATSRVSLLVTSQVPLGVPGEQVHHLAPLSEADAVTLFAVRAKAQRTQLTLDDDASVLMSEVCRSLDGLPLAIELAAARVRSMSLPDLARRLGDRFALLRDPGSSQPERRRALAGAISWSYDLLFPDDHRSLFVLSVFSGSACLDAVECVVAALGVPGDAALDAITRLVDRSLVEVDTGPDGSVRYRLLDSIRAFASARLEEDGRAHLVRSAHATWYADSADWCEGHVRTGEQADCLAFARAERTNIDAALDWCRRNDAALGARIAVGMGWTWVVLGDGTAGAARVRAGLSPAATARQRLEGRLLASWLEASAGNLDLAATDLSAARAIAHGLDDDLTCADVDRHAAFLAIQQGRPDLVTLTAGRSLEVYQRLGSEWSLAGSLVLAAYGALMTGDTATATRHGLAAVAILGRIEDAWVLVHAQALLAGVAQAEGRFADAATALRDAAEKSRSLGFPGQAALHLATLAQVERRMGEDAAAAETFERAIAAARAGADGRLAATARLHLAQLLRAQGAGPKAVRLLEENRDWYAGAGGGDGALLTRCLLYAETGDESALAQVLLEAERGANNEVHVYALEGQARHAALRGRCDEACGLLERAQAIAEQAPSALWEPDRHDRRQALLLLDV